jgi:hypothetical protein
MLPVEAIDGADFPTFEVITSIGRTIEPRDWHARVAVLSGWVWRAQFASDPAAIGGVIRILGEPHEIIGVAVPRFEGAHRIPATRVWIPLADEVAGAPRRGDRPQAYRVVHATFPCSVGSLHRQR